MKILKTAEGIALSCLLFLAPGQGKSQTNTAGTNAPQKQQQGFLKPDEPGISAANAEKYLNSLLRSPGEESYRFVSEQKDNYAGLHQRFQQYYKGFPVENGMYMVHSKSGIITSINGEYIDLGTGFNLSYSLSNAQASAIAINHVLTKNSTNSNTREDKSSYHIISNPLWIIEKNIGAKLKNNYRFAYTVVVASDTHPVEEKICIDANTGEIMRSDRIMSNTNGTAKTRYSGTQTIDTYFSNPNYQLNSIAKGFFVVNAQGGNPCCPGLLPAFTDGDNNWTEFYNNANKDDAALDVFWGFERTLDYFTTKHGHTLGWQLRVMAHYDDTPQTPGWDNAAYLGNGIWVFGDGDANQPLPVTTLDVVGHEYAHGVTNAIAGLSGLSNAETGALSKGFSDIFGACVENYVNGLNILPVAKNIWLDGSEIKPAGYRNIMSPKTNLQPDTYLGNNWISQPGNSFWHTNSTILSHWFYLLAVGSGQNGDDGINDNLETYTVSPIGFAAAEQIAFNSLYYLKSNSGFFDARAASVEAATSIFGAASNEVNQVLKAWHAVGVGSPHCYSTGTVTPASAKYIANVITNGNTHSSTYNACGYTASSATANAVDMILANTQTIALSAESSALRYWAVYLDLNNNRSFADPGELIYNVLGVNPTFTFVIPVNGGPTPGYTYMRVMMSNGSIANSCLKMTDGETEDYRVQILPPDCATPSVLTTASVTPSSAVLQWNAVPYAVNYTVTLFKTGVVQPVLTTVVAAPANTLFVSNLLGGTPYTFMVDAGCQYGSQSTNGNSGGFSTPACSAPGNLAVTAITPTSAVLQWAAVNFAASYTVELFSGGIWSNVGVVSAPAISLALSNLTAGSAYQFRVKSNCLYGVVSPVSAAFPFNTPAWCNADASEPNETQGTSKNIPVSAFTPTTPGAANKTATVNGLICYNSPQYGGTYGDVDWFYFSNQSNIFYQNPLSGFPDVQITLTNLPADYDLKLYNSSNVEIGSSTAAGTNSESIIFHPCFGATGTYYIKVFGYNNAHSLTQNYKLSVILKAVSYICYSPRSSADTSEVTGIEPVAQDAAGLDIFPNPGTGKYSVTTSGTMSNILIFDVAGKLLMNEPLHTPATNYELDISSYPAGLYFIGVSTPSGIINRKIIKN